MKEYTYALCAARHPIPVDAALFPSEVNPLDVDGLRDAAAAIPADCTALTVYVTGLTAAMLAVVSVCAQRGISLTAMHFDRASGDYYAQRVF